jgi:hypothetical protein
MVSNTFVMVFYLKHCDASANDSIVLQLEYTGRIEQGMFLFSQK